MCPTSTSSATFGDIIELTVRVENVGTETIPGLSVRLGLPDGLDARAVNCPFSPVSGITDCLIGDVAAGILADVQFYVHGGSMTANGSVTAFASSGSTVLASTAIASIKIIGPARRRYPVVRRTPSPALQRPCGACRPF